MGYQVPKPSVPSPEKPKLSDFDRKYMETVRNYFESRQKTKTLAESVRYAKKQGDVGRESEFREQLYKTREERGGLLNALQLNSPAELVVHYDDEKIRIEGTARDWIIANYHLTGELDGRAATREDYSVELDRSGLKKFDETKDELKIESGYVLEKDDDVSVVKTGMTTCIYGTLDSRYVVNMGTVVLESEGIQWDIKSEKLGKTQLGKKESIRALEKYILKDPQMRQKIRLIPKWEGGGK